MLPANFFMSASALHTYLECPLHFRLRYVDGLFWNPLWGETESERRALEHGRDFHLLAQRYFAGVEPVRVSDQVQQQEMDGWLRRLQDFLPLTFDRLFYPELELRLNRPGLRLMATFDLLTVDPDGSAILFDWKTTKKPPQRSQMLKEPQTLVYRYMLVAAGGAWSPRGQFRPEEISMIYWNPLYPGRWDRLTYGEEQYREDEERVRTLLDKIASTSEGGFAATRDPKACERCEFRGLCPALKNRRPATP